MLLKNSAVGKIADLRVPRRLAGHSSSIESRYDAIAISELRTEDITSAVSGLVLTAFHMSVVSTSFSSEEAGMSLDSGILTDDENDGADRRFR